jgi:adenylate kinase
MKIVFFGPPGSGKGTQAKLISHELGIVHLSTGDILRNKLKDEDALSVQLQEIMSSGNLVSDELLNQIIVDKLTSKDCFKGFILDGYPRTITQSEFILSFMEKKNIIFDFIFDFQINFQIVQERIISRSQKEKRTDDNDDAIKIRLEKYMEETSPVSNFFKKNFNKNYYTIDASQEISKIQKELIKIIKKGQI